MEKNCFLFNSNNLRSAFYVLLNCFARYTKSFISKNFLCKFNSVHSSGISLDDVHFMPFGTQFGDQYVARGDDVAQCFPVSPHFPLFSTKHHQQICVSAFLSCKLSEITLLDKICASAPIDLVTFNSRT